MATFRDYLADPAPAEISAKEQTRTEEQDFGNCVAFEHINLEVPDLEVARIFYSEVLGLPMDPSRVGSQRGNVNVLWFNAGRQQIHVAKGPAAQLLPPGATIGLVLPDVEAIARHAAEMRPHIGVVPVRHLMPGVIQITDPHGVIFMVHEKYTGFLADRGIAYIHMPCFVGTSALIARFYSHTLGAPVKLLDQPSAKRQGSGGTPVTSAGGHRGHTHTHAPLIKDRAQEEIDGELMAKSSPGHVSSPRRGPKTDASGATYVRPAGPRALVLLGHPGTHLAFYEEPNLGPWNTEAALGLYSGWHICFYISQFSHCYSRLRALIFNTHPYRDKCHNFTDALNHKQFRFQDIVLIPDPFGPPTLELEGKKQTTDIVPVQPPGDIVAPAVEAPPQPPTPPSTPAPGADGGAGGDATAAAAAAPADDAAARAALVARVPAHLAPVLSIVPHVHVGDDKVSDAGVPNQNGQLLYRISHEVRSLAHPSFLRALYNRPHGFA